MILSMIVSDRRSRSDHPIFDMEVNFGISVPTFFIPELKIFKHKCVIKHENLSQYRVGS